MAETARRAGVVLACRQGATRLTAEARTVRQIVRSGVLGEIYFLRLVGRALYRPGIEYNPAARWFLDRSRAGGGALFDLGVYDLELLFGVLGPFEVAAVMATAFTGVDQPELDVPYDVEEHAVAMLRTRHGATIYWERGWATHLPEEHRWDLYGRDAGLSFVAHNTVIRRPLDLQLTRYAPELAIDLPLPALAEPGPTVYQDFLQAVETGATPASPAGENAAMLEIIERVYASAAAPETVAAR